MQRYVGTVKQLLKIMQIIEFLKKEKLARIFTVIASIGIILLGIVSKDLIVFMLFTAMAYGVYKYSRAVSLINFGIILMSFIMILQEPVFSNVRSVVTFLVVLLFFCTSIMGLVGSFSNYYLIKKYHQTKQERLININPEKNMRLGKILIFIAVLYPILWFVTFEFVIKKYFPSYNDELMFNLVFANLKVSELFSTNPLFAISSILLYIGSPMILLIGLFNVIIAFIRTKKYIKCPYCAEKVNPSATKCNYCNTELIST